MISEGAILLARQTIESEVFRDKPDIWFKIWIYLLCKANHKAFRKLERGQCFLKYSWIMEGTKASKSQIDHAIRWFKESQMLATQKATRGFVVTILNYGTYQTLETYKSDTLRDTDAIRTRHRSDTIYKNDKNEKNEKTTPRFSFDSTEIKLANLLLSEIKKRKPDLPKKNLQSWAKHIDRMIRIDKRNPDRIEQVIIWCQKDIFWQDNILSTEKLRKQFDQLELKMNKAQPSKPQPKCHFGRHHKGPMKESIVGNMTCKVWVCESCVRNGKLQRHSA